MRWAPQGALELPARGLLVLGLPARRLLAPFAVTCALGCGGTGAGGTTGPVVAEVPSFVPPSVSSPVRAIPSDLDVVVRIDLDPIRAVLPQGAESRLALAALSAVGASAVGSTGPDPLAAPRAASAVVRQGLLGARQIWIGLRPGPNPAHWDNVLVLRGDFSFLREAELTRAFHPARPLPQGWRVYEARRIEGRVAPAALYAYLDDLWVVASVAEVDAVERVLEGRASEPNVEPPERGVISCAARLPALAALLRADSPKSARLLERARDAQASADLTAEGLVLSAEMRFAEEDEATRAASAVRLLLYALSLGGATWLGDVQVSTMAATVALKAHVPHEVLAGAVESAPDQPARLP